jgi:glycolate oxidase
MFTETDLETMQFIRNSFNSKGLANPGKIFPTPKTCGEAANAKKIELKGAKAF